MSGSESEEIELSGSSAAPRPEDAVREAHSALFKELIARGGAPFHLTALHWLAPDVAAFDPKRHELDLSYREVLGGFRPAITVSKSDSHDFTVQAKARITRPSVGGPSWHGFALPELGREYSPRGQVPDMDALFGQWSRDGRAFLASHAHREIAYGESPYEKLDFFPAAGSAAAPLWVFIHGGYWQASDKYQHAQFAAGMLGAGYAVASLNYGLCPECPLERIVAQVRAAMRLLVSKAAELGFDAKSVHVAGHSAGGHLAAAVASDLEGPPIRSALLLSGLFELAPLALLPVGRLLGLAGDEAIARLSPMRHRPQPGMKIGISVGGLESGEFKWQSEELAKTWGAPPPLVVAGDNHFSLLDGLIEGELLDFARKTAS